MASRSRATESTLNAGPAPLPQQVQVFQSFVNELAAQFLEKLSEEYEREVAVLFNDVSMYRSELTRCAELLGHQLKRERQLHGMLEKAADLQTNVASSAHNVAAQHVESSQRLQESMVSAENEFARLCQLLQTPMIEDRLQERQPAPSLASTGSMRIVQPPPTGNGSFDAAAGGWPDLMYTSADRNFDGITDGSQTGWQCAQPPFKQPGMWPPPFSGAPLNSFTPPFSGAPPQIYPQQTSSSNSFLPPSMRLRPPMSMGPPGSMAPSAYMQDGPGSAMPWGQPLAGTGDIPVATAGIDTTGDGRPNLIFRGADRNRDGIPDMLQANFSAQPGFGPNSTYR